jgi:hypothetical protein
LQSPCWRLSGFSENERDGRAKKAFQVVAAVFPDRKSFSTCSRHVGQRPSLKIPIVDGVGNGGRERSFVHQHAVTSVREQANSAPQFSHATRLGPASIQAIVPVKRSLLAQNSLLVFMVRDRR